MTRPSVDITIRSMTGKDAEAVVRMGNKLNAYHSDQTKFNKAFLLKYGLGAKKTIRIWLALHADKPVGFALTNDWPNFVRSHLDCTLSLLFVEEEWRRHGIGLLLVSHAAKTAVQRGCVRFRTTSSPKNLKVKRFYKSLGFKVRLHKPTPYLVEGKALHQLTKLVK